MNATKTIQQIQGQSRALQRYNIIPDAVYLGRDEWYAIRSAAGYQLYRIEKKTGAPGNSFMGLAVYEVNEQSHVRVVGTRA